MEYTLEEVKKYLKFETPALSTMELNTWSNSANSGLQLKVKNRIGFTYLWLSWYLNKTTGEYIPLKEYTNFIDTIPSKKNT